MTDDKPLEPARLAQGTDFKVVVKVTHTGVRGSFRQLALSHVVASGFEIRNDRLDPSRAHGRSPFASMIPWSRIARRSARRFPIG